MTKQQVKAIQEFLEGQLVTIRPAAGNQTEQQPSKARSSISSRFEKVRHLTIYILVFLIGMILGFVVGRFDLTILDAFDYLLEVTTVVVLIATLKVMNRYTDLTERIAEIEKYRHGQELETQLKKHDAELQGGRFWRDNNTDVAVPLHNVGRPIKPIVALISSNVRFIEFEGAEIQEISGVSVATFIDNARWRNEERTLRLQAATRKEDLEKKENIEEVQLELVYQNRLGDIRTAVYKIIIQGPRSKAKVTCIDIELGVDINMIENIYSKST